MRIPSTVIGLCAVVSLSGCPDPGGRLDNWLDRSEPFRKAPTAGECAGVVDISGSHLLGILVGDIGATAPLRFKLDLTVNVDAATIDATLQPYAVPPNNGETTPGTLVGEVYTASSPIDPGGGTFALDFGSITVPIEANAVLAAEAKANMVLEGCTSSPATSCGGVAGAITAPVDLPLQNTTWAIIPLGDDPLTTDIQSACP